jgi:hypothetical protein
MIAFIRSLALSIVLHNNALKRLADAAEVATSRTGMLLNG